MALVRLCKRTRWSSGEDEARITVALISSQRDFTAGRMALSSGTSLRPTFRRARGFSVRFVRAMRHLPNGSPKLVRARQAGGNLQPFGAST